MVRMNDPSRRDLLAAGTSATALGMFGWPLSASAQEPTAWDQGQLAHLIPTANHERILIKASFKAPLASGHELTSMMFVRNVRFTVVSRSRLHRGDGALRANIGRRQTTHVDLPG